MAAENGEWPEWWDDLTEEQQEALIQYDEDGEPNTSTQNESSSNSSMFDDSTAGPLLKLPMTGRFKNFSKNTSEKRRQRYSRDFSLM